MINGLTHNDGVLNRVQKYRGKIATGLDAGQDGNTTNHPIPIGYFRVCKEKVETRKLSAGKEALIKTWVTNTEVQTKLEAANTPVGAPNNTQPRLIKSISFYKEVCELWDSFLAMYNSSDGMVCRGNGIGSKAKRLFFNDRGEREWREIDCPHTNCEDFKAGKCCENGTLKCFPTVDIVPSLPYQYSSKSINTILAIETGLNDIYYMLRAAHKICDVENGKSTPFDGFFMKDFMMLHKKIKSGGKDVFITEVQPSKNMIDEIMGPINRFMKNKTAMLSGGNSVLSLLDQSMDSVLEKVEIADDIEGTTIDLGQLVTEEVAKSALQQ